MSRKPRKGYYVDGEYVVAEDDGSDPRAGGPAVAETPSRTARKNSSEELQKVGEALLGLRPNQLAGLDLPERLSDAIAEAKRLTSFGAKRRQMQFIGKLMRRLDPETLDAVNAALRAEGGERAARPRHGERG
jgi:ribosome-associated protein